MCFFLFLFLEKITCEVTEFTCSNSRCIPFDLYCNGIDDCQDGSDEKNCTICKTKELWCESKGICLPFSQICDGKLDCPDGLDERDCKNITCEKHEFQCSSQECIPLVSIF